MSSTSSPTPKLSSPSRSQNSDVAYKEMSSVASSQRDDSIIHVTEDYYAIENVVAWKGEGHRRRYLVRWKGFPPEDDTWVTANSLCEDTLREAHQLVRWEKAVEKAKALGEEPPPRPGSGTKGKGQSATKRKQSDKPTGKEKVAKSLDLESDSGSDGEPNANVDSKAEQVGIPKQSPPSKKRRVRTNGSKSHKMKLEKEQRKQKEKLIKEAQRQQEESESDNDLDPVERIQRELAKGNDVSLINYQEVQRINVNDEDARRRVTEARINGVPVVLTGQSGWPQFASRWLKGSDRNVSLDLSKELELDVAKLMQDIGEEKVPIVQKKYDEKNPIEQEMKAKDFVDEFWPVDGLTKSKHKLYLQQWQFPNSEKMKSLLCGRDQCSSLVDNVFDEDLLPFWLNEGLNPYQYLFMGDSGTMSRLHKDPGGLEILIAPIVGVKECILAHRQDGERYLYDLHTKLDKADLNRFPMTAFARIWKTDVKAGEILVMPHDTYHQVRNKTPCLSYHRLYLDVVNLRGFLESMHVGDAKELEHSEVVWNTCHELMGRVDDHVAKWREGKESGSANSLDLERVTKTVHALGLLRQACADIVRCFLEEFNAKNLPSYTIDDWKSLLREIDKTLHEYRNRDAVKCPRFRGNLWESSVLLVKKKETSKYADADSAGSEDEEDFTTYGGKWRLRGIFHQIQSVLDQLPYINADDEDRIISDAITILPGDMVNIRILDRVAEGKVQTIEDEMQAALVSYEGLPSQFDEYQPAGSIHGRSEISKSAIPTALRPTQDCDGPKTTKIVRCVPSGTNNQIREARVISSRTATFYYLKITLPSLTVTRWFCRSSIIGKVNRR